MIRILVLAVLSFITTNIISDEYFLTPEQLIENRKKIELFLYKFSECLEEHDLKKPIATNLCGADVKVRYPGLMLKALKESKFNRIEQTSDKDNKILEQYVAIKGAKNIYYLIQIKRNKKSDSLFVYSIEEVSDSIYNQQLKQTS